MSVLSTSNRTTMSGVLAIAFHPLSRALTSTGNCRGRKGSPSVLLALAEQLPDGLGHALGLESEFSLQLLERSRRTECVHANDTAGFPADVALPAESRGLLHRDARRHLGRQHAVLICLRLVLEDVPGRHRDHARRSEERRVGK